jgi:hypothetical protein
MILLLLVGLAHAQMPCTGTPLPESMRLVRTHDPQDATKWYTLAPCLDAMGFPQVAERALVAGLAVDPRRVREAEILDQLRRYADESGDDRWLLEGAAHLRSEPELFPATRSRLAYAEGKRLAELGDVEGALAALKKVDATAPHGPEARLLAARLAFSIERNKSSAGALMDAYNTTNDHRDGSTAGEFVMDLSVLTIGRIYFDVKQEDAPKFFAEVWEGSPLHPHALALHAFIDPKLSKKALKAARTAWVPDAALLPGAPPETRATWLAHRDALAAFVTAWKSKPAEAVAAWQAAPYAPVEGDLANDYEWSRAAAALKTLEGERKAIDPTLWGSLAPFLSAQLDTIEPYLRERAGVALIRALDARRAQADEVIRKLDAKEQTPLAWSVYDWGP